MCVIVCLCINFICSVKSLLTLLDLPVNSFGFASKSTGVQGEDALVDVGGRAALVWPAGGKGSPGTYCVMAARIMAVGTPST
jgi:hypothetical protein